MKKPASIKRLLTLTGWRQFFSVLNKKERNIFIVLFCLALGSFLFLLFNFYFEKTEIVPAEGGTYTEGMLGSPRFINPVYAATSDVDRDLTELIFSGLMKYNPEGKIVADLAERYEISEGGKIYEFYLKENLFWSDSRELTVNDVLFTVEKIQDPNLKSPLRANWLGVEMEKISELGIRFKLKNPSAVFLENCTLKIMPKHIWQDISNQNFPQSIYNLNPIGSGPYKFKKLNKNKGGNIISLELEINPYYSGSRPNIAKIIFYFFDKEEDLIGALDSKKIKGISLSPSLIKKGSDKYKILNSEKFTTYQLTLPRYFALFLNPDKETGGNAILEDKKIRQALNYGTDKEEIINNVLGSYGKTVYSPVLPAIYGFEEPSANYQFDRSKAEKLLEEAGFIEKNNGIRIKTVKKEAAFQFKSTLKFGSSGTEVKELQKCLAKDSEIYPEGEITGYFGEKTKKAVISFQEKYKTEILEPYGLEKGTGQVLKSTRAKLNELCAPPPEETIPLSFSLSIVNQPVFEQVAAVLKAQWEFLGIDIEIKSFEIDDLEQKIIKPRNYQMLLFGEVLNSLPDLFPFWHSSQKKDPGLNLADYENKKCDKLLETARQTLDENERKTSLENFQELIIEDAPAVFLYNPDYLYLISKEIKGVKIKIITDSSKRFSEIENWYIKTSRSFAFQKN